MREPARSHKRKHFKRKRDNYARKLKKNNHINNYLRKELGSCTTHGLPYIVNTEIHCVERLFWAACFICCIGIVGCLISSQFARYFRDPVVMSVEMDYFNWNISFPAITLCPNDNYDEEDLQNIVNETLQSIGMDLTAILKSVVLTGLDGVDTINFNHEAVSEQILDPRDFREMMPILFKKFNNDCLTTSTNWPITVNSAITELGVCYVLNSNIASYDEPFNGRDNTAYEKTNIELSVYDKDFFIQLRGCADEYKLYLHHPDEIVLVTTPSYDISTGFTTLAVKVWSTRMADILRLIPLYYRKCRFLDEPISNRYPVYSYNHCLLECRLRMMLKLCNCIPHFYKILAHEKVCEIKQLECIKQYKKELVKLSSSENTRRRFINRDDLPKSPRDCNCLSNCETDIYLKEYENKEQDNEIVRIGISSFPKVRVMRHIIFNIFDIIFRSGGVMNVCIGTSIISLMELLLIAIKIFTLAVMNVTEPVLHFISQYNLGNK